MKARFASRCPKCTASIAKDTDIFYFPLMKKAFCKSCGETESAQFALSKVDEELYQAQY
jgi:hypothetical protein